MTNSTKYIGMDVHKESISMAVRNAAGKIVDGMCHRDESEHDPGVCRRASRGRACHL
jgi:hypothetical protein